MRSGTVGPEAITAGSSPGTSEMVSVTTLAGWHAAARRPPLMADRCLRTQFISAMLAPLLSSARLIACLSCSVRPGAGSVSSAEPPPEMRHSTRSSGRQPLDHLQDALGGLAARRVGHRMRGLDDLDALAGA